MLARVEAIPGVWRDLLALTKPRITVLVLLTTAGGLWLAPDSLSPTRSLLALLATMMVVAAANIFNCYLERDTDRLMTRTENRPLPSGRLDPKMALALGIFLAGVSIPALTFGVNLMTGFLGAFALISYVAIYTPMKQKSPLALSIGAIPGAIPPLLGFTAATGKIELPGLALFGILFFWQLPHFLAIALFRKEEYRRAGIKVLPVVKGDKTTKLRMPLYVIALLLCSWSLVPLGVAGWFYFALATLLGLAFLLNALLGLRKNADANWARSFFFSSLVYLPLLFVAIALDAS